MKYVLLSLGLCLQEKNSHFFHTEEQMNIQQVATSTDHRHREFAGRVLEDDLALWACFLYPMEQMIKARGGSVRPRVEFSERQARLQAWQDKMCAKFEVAPPKRSEKQQTKTTNPDQGVEIALSKSLAKEQQDLGMDEEFFNMLDGGDELDQDFFAED
jgi:hypothetical protein